MKYNRVKKAIFEARPNRFLAQVYVDGELETVHVKNTGRCRELLLPGVEVILEEADNQNRKTKYDLVMVYKKDFGLINMDSQAPNKVVKEWLEKQNYSFVKPEYKYGNSRIDFYMERRIPDGEEVEKYLMEVKGCTLEKDGVGYFPDAPTERGVKHLRELTRAVMEGYHAIVAFVIQMEGVTEVRPNVETHKEFGEALAEARAAGVEVVFLYCEVTEERLSIVESRNA